jgi:DMSO/TMAO reductase YedYZ molybdopterin-dependent catalytic subunit
MAQGSLLFGTLLRVCFALGIACWPAVAYAEQPSASFVSALSEVTVKSKLRGEAHLSLAEIEKMPATDVHASFHSMHGEKPATYTGPLLWDVLAKAQAYDPAKPGSRVGIVVKVIGRDGYTIALALAEIDPEFEGKRVILAYRKDGQRLPKQELRLIVPGDKRGARSVRNVATIVVE